MAVNYFNGTGSDSDIIDSVVEQVEFRLVGDKMQKITSPVGGLIVESTIHGDVQETDTKVTDLVTKIDHHATSREVQIIQSIIPDMSRARVGEAVVYAGNDVLAITDKIIDRDAVIENIKQYVEYPETVIVKGSDVVGSSYKLFPVYLVAHRDMEIVSANVVLKFTSEMPVRTDNYKALSILIGEGSGGASYSSILTPTTARVFMPTYARAIMRGERYNVELKFGTIGKAWEILDSAIITLFYRYK